MTKKTEKETQIKSIERMKKHGEVLTALREIESMLDLVKSEFDNPDKIFLEPACGDGNFLTAVLDRKLKKAEDEKDLFSALNSIHGIDLLEDNIKYAKKRLLSLWIEKYKAVLKKEPSKSILKKAEDIINSNIIQGNFLECREYEKLNIDVIIGNPPYQIVDGGGTGDSAKPIYQNFIKQSKNLNPNFITLIIPSRWMKGGKGLKEFRQEMINDRRIKKIYDYENGQTCFPDLHIDGGICYFLWSKNHNGKAEYHHYSLDGTERITTRFLKNKYTDTVIRDFRQESIIKKSVEKKEDKFSSIVFSRNPFGFYADLFNNPERYPEIKVLESGKSDLYKIYGVKGKKGNSKRTTGYISPSVITKNKTSALSYKLFFSKAYTSTSTVPPEIILAEPKEVCTETFLQIGRFSNKTEAENCLSYIKTKFFRALLFFNRHSLNISRKSFELIPIQDFSEEWSDEKLYKKYGLDQNEIEYINSVIKPMN